MENEWHPIFSMDIVEKSGNILAAHCIYMAGLDEGCSIFVPSYSTLNIQLKFAIRKLAQRRKHIGFCQVIIQLNTKKSAKFIFQQLRHLRKT